MVWTHKEDSEYIGRRRWSCQVVGKDKDQKGDFMMW